MNCLAIDVQFLRRRKAQKSGSIDFDRIVAHAFQRSFGASERFSIAGGGVILDQTARHPGGRPKHIGVGMGGRIEKTAWLLIMDDALHESTLDVAAKIAAAHLAHENKSEGIAHFAVADGGEIAADGERRGLERPISVA